MKSLLVAPLVFLAGCASSPIDNGTADEEALQLFRDTKATSQLWKSDQPPPLTLADIGFSKDFRVCYLALWQDGGSLGYLFRDKVGRYFACCRCYPRYFDGQEVVTVTEPVYFVGVLYPAEAGGRKLERGSASEAFVRSMIEGKRRPNQPPEPTVMSVTPRADARVAPATTVAHL